MFYKVTSFVFLAASVAFASLYFVEKSSNSIPPNNNITSIEYKDSKRNSTKQAVKVSPTGEVKSKTVVVKREVSSHPNLSSHEIDLLLEVKDSMSRDYSRRLEREHPMLFERLNLDEESKKAFKLLVGERRLGLNMRSSSDMSEADKEEFSLKKEEILSDVDNKIASLLGGQFDVYINYRDKARQYQLVSGINQRLQSSGESMALDQQDKLASLMFDSRQSFSEENSNVDWQDMRNDPAKAQQALEEYRKKNDILKEQIDFLSENQKKVFISHLDYRFKRYENWIKRITEGKDRRQ